jgi:hypothetical protein
MGGPIRRLFPEASNVNEPPKHVVFTGDGFVVRAVIQNKGPGTLRSGLLNIIVPSTCALEVLDIDKSHYASPMVDTMKSSWAMER